METATVAQERLMQAIVQDRYGAPEEVLELARIPVPAVGDDEALVRVHATPVAGDDWHLLRGLPYLARLIIGLRKPKSRIPGLSVAGTVERVGAAVTEFQPGDEVFGWSQGTFAEYAAIPVAQILPKPSGVGLLEAAAVPIAAFTALQGVRDKGLVQTGQTVLITGASGGVGTYAVQIASRLGAEVTAVCSGAKADLVRALGASHVIDYTRENFADSGGRFDVIIDLYGNPTLSDCRRALRPGGTLVLIGGTGGKWFMGLDRALRWLLLAPFLPLRVRLLIHKDRLEDLMTLKEMIDAGDLKPIIDKTYPLGGVAEAIQYVTDGRARGQVMVTL